jgi:hypothetical protein
MASLLDTLLGGQTLDEVLSEGAKEIRAMGARTCRRVPRATDEGCGLESLMYGPVPPLLRPHNSAEKKEKSAPIRVRL